jgi:hypothetical protein
MRGISTFLAATLAVVACSRGPSTLPPELLGTWQTSAPQYDGRYLELRPQLIIFGTGSGAPEEHALANVEVRSAGLGTTHYTIHYRAEDGAILTLELDHSAGPPDTLRLSNRDFDWHKQSPTSEAS